MTSSKKTRRRAGPAVRMAKMVSPDTNAQIEQLGELLRKEQRRETRPSDNQVIRIAVLEAIEDRTDK